MQKLLVILDFPHHRRHSVRFPVPLLLHFGKQVLLRRPWWRLENTSTWEWKPETCLKAAAVRYPQILPESFSSPLEPRWLARHPPQTWGQCPFSEPYSQAPARCSVSLPMFPLFTGFHEHFHSTKLSVNYCNPYVLVTSPFGKNACFPILGMRIRHS